MGLRSGAWHHHAKPHALQIKCRLELTVRGSHRQITRSGLPATIRVPSVHTGSTQRQTRQDEPQQYVTPWSYARLPAQTRRSPFRVQGLRPKNTPHPPFGRNRCQVQSRHASNGLYCTKSKQGSSSSALRRSSSKDLGHSDLLRPHIKRARRHRWTAPMARKIRRWRRRRI